jgi:hypothetical protein
VLFEGFHAFDDFPTGTRLEDLAKRADVRVGLGRTGENLSNRPFPTFVDVILWTGVLHGVVEMAEMSQVNAQPRKSVLLEHSRPENRICPILIICVWPKAMAGVRHDGHIIGAAPRVELCERSIELAADMRSQPRIGGAQICWLVEVRVRQMFVVSRPKSPRRIQLDADKSACDFGRVAEGDVIHLDGATHDRHWVPICGTGLMVVERLSQRIESDETVHAWTILPTGDPRHDLDLIRDA